MNSTVEKIFTIAIGVVIVLFLLLDGGSMTEATIRSGAAASDLSPGRSWVWVIPTLLIFGMGFLLAWLVLGKDESPTAEDEQELPKPSAAPQGTDRRFWPRTSK